MKIFNTSENLLRSELIKNTNNKDYETQNTIRNKRVRF